MKSRSMPSRLLSGLIFALITLGVQGARDPFDENKALHTNTNAPKSTHSRVALLTPYGQIAMKLLHSNAPKAAAAVWDLAEKGTCSDCRFYRAEARPNFSLLQDATGPPYALLQGQMSLPEPVQPEGSLPVKAGCVAFIPGTTDFFIALADHTEWGTSHIVFAEVEDFVSTDLIAIQRYHEVTHEKYGTVMRMMDKPVSFTVANKGILTFTKFKGTM